MRRNAVVVVAVLAVLTSSLAACRGNPDADSAGSSGSDGRAGTGTHADPLDAGPASTLPPLTVTDRRTDAEAVSSYLIGGNQRWLGNADGVWSGGTRPNRQIVALSRRIGMRSVRYPGGTVAGLFDYQRMTGAEPSGCQTSGGFAADFFAPIRTGDTQYTIPRHAEFMAALPKGARTQLMIPMTNASPSQAVDFVATMARRTHQKVWNVEIGNEPYLANQRYWRSTDYRTRLDQYIRGGSAHQPEYPHDKDYRGNQRLYPVHGCDVRAGAAKKATGLTYRVRFGPILTAKGRRPVVRAGDRRFRWVPTLAGAHGRVFTTREGRVIFPKGTRVSGRNLTIDYWSGYHHGFVDYYQKLKAFDASHPGLRVNVCSSWARPGFVDSMRTLARRTHGRQGRYDCIAVHSYSSPWAKTVAGAHRQLNDAARRLADDLGELRRGMRSGPAGVHAGGRFLIVTEYGVLNPAMHDVGSRFLYDLYVARLMMGQVRHSVRTATMSNFAAQFSNVHGRYRLTGRGMVQSLYARLAGQRPVTVRTAGRPGVWLLGTQGDRGRYSLLAINTRGSGGLHRSLAVPGGTQRRCVVSRSLSAPLGARTVATARHPTIPTTDTSARTWRAGSRLGVAVPAHSIVLYSIRPGTC